MGRILVFGDSSVWGAWDKRGGWVERLREFIDKKNLKLKNSRWLVYNLGVSGDTTEDLLRRFEFETEQRLLRSRNKDIIIIFSVGKNDAAFVKSKNDLFVPPEIFEKNIRKLIELSKKYSSKILFMSPFPIDEEKTTPLSWDANFYHKNEPKKKYTGIIGKVCMEENVYFLDVFEKTLKLKYKKMLHDGLHLNTKGHEMIFRIVRKFLQKEFSYAVEVLDAENSTEKKAQSAEPGKPGIFVE